MDTPKPPLSTTQAVTSHSNAKEKPKHTYVTDSARRIFMIAEHHGLDASLRIEKPKKTLLDRALERELNRKRQRQKNLENIVRLAHHSCHDEVAGEPDSDWLYHFFDMAQEINNSSMQRLWAQVLKKEVLSPGFTSLKALKILESMTPKEAQVLQKAAALSCSFGSDSSLKLVFGTKSPLGAFRLGKRVNLQTLNLANHQLPYSNLLVLIELGLLHANELESGEIEPEPPLQLHYQGKQLMLLSHSKGLRLVYYRFTPTGNELCRLLGHKINPDYYDQLIALLSSKFSVQEETSTTLNHSV